MTEPITALSQQAKQALFQLCLSLPAVSDAMDADTCLPLASEFKNEKYLHDRFISLMRGPGGDQTCILKKHGIVLNGMMGDQDGALKYNEMPKAYVPMEGASEGGYSVECLRFMTVGFAGALRLAGLATAGAVAWNWKEVLAAALRIIQAMIRFAPKFADAGDAEFPIKAPPVEVAEVPQTQSEKASTGSDSNAGGSPDVDPRPQLRRIFKEGGEQADGNRRRRPEECDNKRMPWLTDNVGRFPENVAGRFNLIQSGSSYIPPYGSVLKHLGGDQLHFLKVPVKIALKDTVSKIWKPVTFREVPLLYGLGYLSSAEIFATNVPFFYMDHELNQQVLIFMESDDCEILGVMYGALHYDKFEDERFYPVLSNYRIVKYDDALARRHTKLRSINPSSQLPAKLGLAGYIVRLLSVNYHDYFRGHIKHERNDVNRMVMDYISMDLLDAYRKYMRVYPVSCNETMPTVTPDSRRKPLDFDVTVCEVRESLENLDGMHMP